MKRYAESRTQDEYGDIQDGVYESEAGEYIKLDELLKWLDIEIAMAEDNLEEAESCQLAVIIATARAMLGTYKEVKAHLTS